MHTPFKTLTFSAMGLATLMGCTSMSTPRNIEPVASGQGYQSQYREPQVSRADARFLQAPDMNQTACLPPIGGTQEASIGKWSPAAPEPLLGEKLSRGDLVHVVLDGDDVFGGDYVVSRDGALKLPHLPPIPAQGRSTVEIEAALTRALVDGAFYAAPPRLSVRMADFASVSVGVSGAVFEPHIVQIGGISGDRLDTGRQSAPGASTEGRNLSAALRSAGGIRPDADLSAVEVHRAGRIYRLDLRNVFNGQDTADIMLLTGDEVVVKSRQCFQDDLMRPSPISPPGVSLYLSNLTQPATGNAPSAVGREVREVPYGARYMQAVIDTNCVGGAKTTNANRSAVLFSRNPITGVSVVIERDIEDLLRRADRDDFDPYLLPGDAIACYDSTVTNITEVARVVGTISLGLVGLN